MEISGRMEKYYIKTRDLHLKREEAMQYGIRRVYNYTSEMEFMGHLDMRVWSNGLKRSETEVVLIESAIKFIEGVPLYVSTGIVFQTQEMSNIFYIKNLKSYHDSKGFFTILN
jgi:hypothetical protein